MLLSEVRKISSPYMRLCYWIVERELIRWRKEEQGWGTPYTDDSILTQYRFCNVRRMDDRVSRWLYDNWYTPHFGHKNMLPACALARMFNLPFTLGAFTPSVFGRAGAPVDLWAIHHIVHGLKKAGHRTFNAAYIVPPDREVKDKIDAVLDLYVKPLCGPEAPCVVTRSMEATWNRLRTCRGFGGFLAGQVVADLRWAVAGTWADRHHWAPMGPGSKRGLNRVKGRPSTAPLSQKWFIQEFTPLCDKLRADLPGEITKKLEAHDIQNCLCEFDKYERCLWGEGTPKQLYHPFKEGA
jgi:hypothetical protein